MSEITSAFEKYKQDPRTPCKYGDKCYQKNTVHLSEYKHPPKKSKRKNNPIQKLSKRVKLDQQIDNIDEKPSAEEDNLGAGSSTSVNEKPESKKECISSSDSEENDETLKGQDNVEGGSITNVNKNVEDKKECISPSDSDECDETPKEQTLLNTNRLTELDEKEKESSTCALNKNEGVKDEEIHVADTSKSFDPKLFIKSRFLVDVPNDFYEFWEFCNKLKPADPCNAFKDVGLKLVGPYDVLAGKFKQSTKSPEEYLQHWRYYYDPPEVLTVVKGDDKTGYHIGYFYDSPYEAPSFLVSNHGTKDGVFTKMGDNIFAAISLHLEELKKIGDPFKKMHVGKLLSAIKTSAEKLKLDLTRYSKKVKERQLKVVAKTFNKIGLAVPYNKKTQLGYRDLAMDDKDLMTLLTKLQKASPEQKSKYLSDLQPVLTYANIALDECDFGTGVKLGWELLYHGIDGLNSTISQFFANSYRLLNKEPFARIAEAHMSRRKKGCNLSIV